MKTFIILTTLAFVAAHLQLSWAVPAKRELKPVDLAEMANLFEDVGGIENIPILAKREADPQPVRILNGAGDVEVIPVAAKRQVPVVPLEIERKMGKKHRKDGNCACLG